MDRNATLARLPLELLESIAELLASEREVNSLCRANRRLHAQLTPYLYKRNARHREDYYDASAVRWAAARGRADTIRRAIASGVCVADEKSSLGAAVDWGHFEAVELLLSVPGLDIESDFHRLQTPLCLAADNGDLRIARLLVDEHGANVNMPACEGKTPLLIAVLGHRVEMAKFLVSRGAHVEPPSATLRQPLLAAARNGNCELGRLLLDHGARPDGAGFLDFTPVHFAALCGHADFLELLLGRGAAMDRRADLLERNLYQQTPVQLAFTWKMTETAKMLLERGADVTVAEGCETLLSAAAFHGECEMLEHLLRRGGVNMYGEREAYRVLCDSTRLGKVGVIRVLVAHGLSARRVGEQEAALMVAVNSLEEAHHEIVGLLIDAGADVEEKDGRGRTALHHAAYRGDIKVVSLLLDRGADPTATDNTGATAAHHAARSGQVETIRVLRGIQGVDIHALDGDGRTPFFHAAMRGRTDVLRVLAESPPAAHGNDNAASNYIPDMRGNIRDIHGLSPLLAALRNQELGACNVLLNELGAGSADKADMDVVGSLMCTWEGDDDREKEDEESDVSNMLEKEWRWCDACTRPAHRQREYPRTCIVCLGGEYLLCNECVEAGTSCLDTSHETVESRPDY